MAVPVVAAVGAQANGTTTTATLNEPAGVSAGNLLIAVLGSDTSTNTFAQPEGGGWTLRERSTSGADCLEVWWKIATGSDSYAFKQSGANPWIGTAFRLTGHDPTTPISTSGKSNSASAVTTLKTAVITTTRAESLVLSIFGEDGDATGIGFSSAGATEFFDVQEASSFCEIAGYSEEKATPGEISRTLTLEVANECNSVILAVQPPEAAGGAPPVRGSLNLLGVGR